MSHFLKVVLFDVNKLIMGIRSHLRLCMRVCVIQHCMYAKTHDCVEVNTILS